MTVNNRHRASMRNRLTTEATPGTLGKRKIGETYGERSQAVQPPAAERPRGRLYQLSSRFKQLFEANPRDAKRFAAKAQFVPRKPVTGLAKLGQGGQASAKIDVPTSPDAADQHLDILNDFLLSDKDAK